MDSLKQHISILIANDETDEAIEVLLKKFSNDNDTIYKEIVLISSQFNNLKSQIRGNLISFDIATLERNKINNFVLELVSIKIPEIISAQAKISQNNFSVYKEYLISLKNSREKNIKQFNTLSVAIFTFGIIIIFIPKEIIGIQQDEKNVIEFIKIGFGLFGIVLPMWLQGVNFRKREKIISLNTLIYFIEDAKQLKEEFINKIENEVFQSMIHSLKND